jgi:hypothetical protein
MASPVAATALTPSAIMTGDTPAAGAGDCTTIGTALFWVDPPEPLEPPEPPEPLELLELLFEEPLKNPLITLAASDTQLESPEPELVVASVVLGSVPVTSGVAFGSIVVVSEVPGSLFGSCPNRR